VRLQRATANLHLSAGGEPRRQLDGLVVLFGLSLKLCSLLGMRMLLLLLTLVASGSAWAQCTTNTECPQGGTCTNGACTTPGATEVESTSAAPATRGISVGDQAKRAQPHWAGGAAVLGFIATGPVVASGIIAMTFLIFGSNQLAGGIGFTLLTMALVGALCPVVELGAASARFDESNDGSPGGRIVGWVFYGLSLASGLGTLLALIGNTGFSVFGALGMLITGGIALLCFGVDAVASGARANAINERRSTSSVVRVMPSFALAPTPRGDLTPQLGFAGTF
jgi:hypothetical protein